ncbi:hypothetical protein L249_4483, partial [Ophiocordyceps polyrhachis-furcata BCC 54312]
MFEAPSIQPSRSPPPSSGPKTIDAMDLEAFFFFFFLSFHSLFLSPFPNVGLLRHAERCGRYCADPPYLALLGNSARRKRRRRRRRAPADEMPPDVSMSTKDISLLFPPLTTIVLQLHLTPKTLLFLHHFLIYFLTPPPSPLLTQS